MCIACQQTPYVQKCCKESGQPGSSYCLLSMYTTMLNARHN